MSGRPRILVADDERGIRLLLERGLSGLGYAILAVADTEHALAAFRAHRYDVVITDMAMLGMTGWELTAELHKLDASVPIILFSGHGRMLEEQAAKHRVLLLHKPQSLHEIAMVVGEVVTAVRTGRPAFSLLPDLSPGVSG